MALNGITDNYYLSSATKSMYLNIEWEVLSQDKFESASEVQFSLYLHRPRASSDYTTIRGSSSYNDICIKSTHGTLDNYASYPNPWVVHEKWIDRNDRRVTEAKYLIRKFTCKVQHIYDGSSSVTVSILNFNTIATYSGITRHWTINIDPIDRCGKVIQSEFVDDNYVLSFVPSWNRESGYLYDYETVSISGARDPIAFNLTRNFMYSTYELDRDVSEWYKDFPSAVSKIYNIEITQRNNGSTTSDVVRYDMVVSVPDDAAPSIDTSLVDIVSSAAYGLVQKYTRAYVMGDIDCDFYTIKYGATLAELYITVEGKNRSFDATPPVVSAVNPPTALTDYFEGYGDIPVYITVKDSRGLTTTKSKTISVSRYFTPSLSNVYAYRSLANGTADEDEGEHIAVKCDFSGCVDGILDRCEAVLDGTSTYTLTSGVQRVIPDISKTSSYDIVITVYDLAGNTSSFSARIPTVYATFNAMNGGHGAAFGKMSETEELLDVAWDIRTEGKLIVNETEMTEDELKVLKKFNPSAITGLETRVGNAESSITDHESRIASAETGVQALEQATSVQVGKWSYLTYMSGFDGYSGHVPTVTRVGCFVYLDGMITTTKVSGSTSSDIVMASLPEWARPRVRVNLLMQGSSSCVWWLEINTDGTIVASRYRTTNSTSYTTIPNGAQLPVSASWIAADAYNG